MVIHADAISRWPSRQRGRALPPVRLNRCMSTLCVCVPSSVLEQDADDFDLIEAQGGDFEDVDIFDASALEVRRVGSLNMTLSCAWPLSPLDMPLRFS